MSLTDNLILAIQSASSPFTDPITKKNAIDYLELMKQSVDAWKVCLPLCAHINNPQQIQTTYFSMQVLEITLRSQFHNLNMQEQQSMNDFIHQQMDLITSETPSVLRNKLALLSVLLFKYYIPTQSTYFDSRIASVTRSIDSEHEAISTDLFLRISLIIDEEIVCRLINRSQKELELNTNLKDLMRTSAVPKLVELWLFIINHFTSKSTNTELTNNALVALAKYISWIDISLFALPVFLEKLCALVNDEKYQVAASECITEIVGKGMQAYDKLTLISSMNVIQLITSLNLTQNDNFKEYIAKLVNTLGLELVKCWETGFESAEELSMLANIADTACNDIQFQALLLLKLMIPTSLSLLADVSNDISSTMLPFMSQLISLMKRQIKAHAVLENDLENIAMKLMQGLVMKLKYDEEELSNDHDGEEIVAVEETRFAYKTVLGTLSLVLPEMFLALTSNLISTTFVRYKESRQGSWSDCELALYLLLGYSESVFGIYPFTSQQSTSNSTLGKLLQSMMESKISQFTHDKITLLYFEILHRYWIYFEFQQHFLPEVMESFVDTRGVHNASFHIRSRVYFLFQRFVKVMKLKLQFLVEPVLKNCQDILVVPRELTVDPSFKIEDITLHSRQYFFEAIGNLISLESLSPDLRTSYLSMVTTPILLKMQSIFNSDDPLDTLYLCALIASLGSITKGFPDFQINNSTPIASTELLKTLLQGLVSILGQKKDNPNVRNAVRFTFQRMVSHMGIEALNYLVPLINAGLFETESAAKELIEFVNFFGLVIFKFKAQIYGIVDSMFLLLLGKIFTYLNQTAQGTDDALAMIELRKSYIAFILVIINADLEGILTSDKNASQFNTIIQSILHFMQDPSDAYTQKLATTALCRMIICFGGQSIDFSGLIPHPNKPTKKGGVIQTFEAKTSLVPGFDTFIFETIIPLVIQLPSMPGFVFGQANSLNIIPDIAVVHKAILISQGKKYTSYLSTVYFPSIQVSKTKSDMFIESIERIDHKPLAKRLSEFYYS